LTRNNKTPKKLNQIVKQTHTRGMKIEILINGKKKNNLVEEHVGSMGKMEKGEI
jgi:hypothetical protein